MFGLSIQEKLFKQIWRLCDEKLPVFEKEMRALIKDSETMNSDNFEEVYCGIVGRYSDEISSVLAEKYGRTAAIKAGLALQSPQIAGFPEGMDTESILDTGPLIGNYFGLYYYAITGNKFALSDYGKYIRPLNQHQVELMNTIIQKLSRQ